MNFRNAVTENVDQNLTRRDVAQEEEQQHTNDRSVVQLPPRLSVLGQDTESRVAYQCAHWCMNVCKCVEDGTVYPGYIIRCAIWVNVACGVKVR